MSFGARRVGALSHSPPRSPRRPTVARIHPSADKSFSSSPPSRRMRSDNSRGSNSNCNNKNSNGVSGGGSTSSGRYGILAPAAPSFTASPRVSTIAAAAVTTTNLQPRARSKPATQRRTGVPTPSTDSSATHQNRSKSNNPQSSSDVGQQQHQPRQQSRRGWRREKKSEVMSVATERLRQRTQVRKATSEASSARRVARLSATPPPPPVSRSLPTSSFSVIGNSTPITTTTNTTAITSNKALSFAAGAAVSVPGSSAELASYQTPQHLGEMHVAPPGSVLNGAFPAVRGKNNNSNSSGYDSRNHQHKASANATTVSAAGGERGVTSPLASPIADLTTPPRSGATTSNSCSLPPMLGQQQQRQEVRASTSSGSCEAYFAFPGGLSHSAPLLRTQTTTPDRETTTAAAAAATSSSAIAAPTTSLAMLFHVPLMGKFMSSTQVQTYSPAESASPPMPPITSHPKSTACSQKPLLSSLSSPTLTDSAVTPHGGGYLSWSPSGSISDEMSAPPQHLHAPLKSSATKTAIEDRRPSRSPPPHPQQSSTALPNPHSQAQQTHGNPAAGTATLAAASTTHSVVTTSSKHSINGTLALGFKPLNTTSTTVAAPFMKSRSSSSVSDGQPTQSTIEQQQQSMSPTLASHRYKATSGVATVVPLPQGVLTASSSSSFNSSPPCSPTGPDVYNIRGSSGAIGAAAPMRHPASRDGAAVSFANSTTPTWPLSLAQQQQHPPQHIHKTTPPASTLILVAALPTVATTHDPHTPVTVSPNPTRLPRANGSTPRHVSISADRRTLLGSSVAGGGAAIGAGSTAAISAARSVSKSPTGTLSTEAAKKALKDRRRRELYAWNEMMRKKNEAGVQDAV